MGPRILSPVQSCDILWACQKHERKYVAYHTANKWGARHRSGGGFLNTSVSWKQWHCSNNIWSTVYKTTLSNLWCLLLELGMHTLVLSLNLGYGLSACKEKQLETGREKDFFLVTWKSKGVLEQDFFFFDRINCFKPHRISVKTKMMFSFIEIFISGTSGNFSLETLKSFTPERRDSWKLTPSYSLKYRSEV